MKEDSRDDLVSMTAIVAGAVVSVVVTIGSMIMSDEQAPTSMAWRVIETYETIERMTATEPSLDAVDRTLDQLMSRAERYPENLYIQELYLKELRVANYHAVASEDDVRASELAARFDNHAVRFMEHEGPALEWMRFKIQRHEQRCDRRSTYDTELLVALEQFVGGRGAIEEFLETGVGRCG